MSSSVSLRQPSKRERLLRVSSERQIAILDVVGLCCRIDLQVEVGGGEVPTSMKFVVDTGASYSLVSLEVAIELGIPVPPSGTEVELNVKSVRGTGSMIVRPGRLRAWWDRRLQGYPFDWPVLFQVNAPLHVPPILGLGGVVKTCKWTFDGSYSPDSPFGYLTLDDIR